MEESWNLFISLGISFPFIIIISSYICTSLPHIFAPHRGYIISYFVHAMEGRAKLADCNAKLLAAREKQRETGSKEEAVETKGWGG